MKAVETDELKIHPPMFKKTWYTWLGEIRDWCISRQLWWGHRIPAYLISIDGKPLADTMENWVVCCSEKEALEIAKKRLVAHHA